MSWFDWVTLVLAASAIIDVWFNGDCLAESRAYWQARGDNAGQRRDLLAELMNCPFCLSHHTPWILALVFFVPSLWLLAPWDTLVKLPVYCLAATRLGNLINAWAPRTAQYGRADESADEPDNATGSDPSDV